MEKNDEKKKNLAGVDTGCACGKCASECEQERTEKKGRVSGKTTAERVNSRKNAHLNIDDLKMMSNLMELRLEAHEERMKKMLVEPKCKKSSKAMPLDQLRVVINVFNKMLEGKGEILDQMFEMISNRQELIIGLLCDLFEVMKVNPIDKSESLRRYLVYYHTGMVSDRPGYKVLKGRLINANGKDETDERFYNAKKEGKCLGEVNNETFDSEFGDDGGRD